MRRHQNAKLSREISEIAVKEYEEGIYLQNLAAAEGEIRLAEADIKGSIELDRGSHHSARENQEYLV